MAAIDLYSIDFSIHWPVSLLTVRKYLLLLAVFIFVAAWGYVFWLIWKGKRPPLLERARALLARMPLWLRGLVSLVILLFPAYFFLYNHFGLFFSNKAYWLKLALVCVSALIAYLVFSPRGSGLMGVLQYCSLVCLAGVFYSIGAGLNQVTNYPFSLSWSEGNRFWDYSMMFGINRYIIPAGKPAVAFIEKGRQFLWSIPFLIPQSGIEVMRLWDELVWIIPALVLGWVAVIGQGKIASKRGCQITDVGDFFWFLVLSFPDAGTNLPDAGIVRHPGSHCSATQETVDQQPAAVAGRLLCLYQPLDLDLCARIVGRNASLVGTSTTRI